MTLRELDFRFTEDASAWYTGTNNACILGYNNHGQTFRWSRDAQRADVTKKLPGEQAPKVGQAAADARPVTQARSSLRLVAEALADRFVDLLTSQPELVSTLLRETAPVRSGKKPSMQIPEIEKISLQGRAKYADREPGTNVLEFLRIEYKDLMDQKILSFCSISKYDMPLYTAIKNHKKKHGLPSDIVLLTKQEITDFYLETAALGLPLPRQVRDRLRYVKHDRRRRASLLESV